MIRLRRLAIVLVAIGLVTSAIYGTGAFSSLSTSRNANVAVVGDEAGYLGLTPGENGEYTTYQNGELQLRLSGALEGEDAPRGGGVNREAETTIESVFIITNQGAQSVGVWLADTNDAIAFERESGASLEGEGNAVQLDPGDPVAVTVRIDTRQATDDALETDLTINADQGVEGVAVGSGSSGDSGDSPTNGDDSSSKENGDGSNDHSDNNEKEDCGLTCKAGDLIFSDDGDVDLNGDEKDDVEQVTTDDGKIDLTGDEKDDVGQFTSIYPDIDITGDGKIIEDEMTDKFYGTLHGDFDGDGTPVWEGSEPIDAIMGPYGPAVPTSPFFFYSLTGDHDDYPMQTGLWKGATFGQMGQEGGIFQKENCDEWTCASEETANSPEYLVGWVGTALSLAGATALTGGTTGGALAVFAGGLDVRDGVQNLANGNHGSAVLDLVGPFADVLKGVGKGIKYLPDLPMKKAIKDAPRSAGARGLEAVTDAPATKLSNKGIPLRDIYKYHKEGIDYQLVLELRSKGMDIPPEDIRHYVDEGTDLELVKNARQGGPNSEAMSPNKIRSLVSEGSQESIETLAEKQGYSLREIDELMNKGGDVTGASELRSQDVSKADIDHLVDEGADLKKASELKKQETPDEHLKYYAENDIEFSSVSNWQDRGFSPETTYRMAKAIKTGGKSLKYSSEKGEDFNELDKLPKEKQLEILNKELDPDIRITETMLELVKAESNHQTWEDGRNESQAKYKMTSRTTTLKIFERGQLVA